MHRIKHVHPEKRGGKNRVTKRERQRETGRERERERFFDF